jgi:hypothetical protein
MNYKQILSILREAAEAVNPKGKFINGRKPDGTQDYEPPFPIIELNPIRTTINRNEGIYNHGIVLHFWTSESLENDRQTTENNIADMHQLCNLYAMYLYENTSVMITEERMTPEYPNTRRYGGKTTGYSLAFNLITKEQC